MQPLKTAMNRTVVILTALFGVAQSRNVVAQAPPDPDFARLPVFESYAAFRGDLDRIAGLADAGDRAAALDKVWATLREAGQIPYAQGDKAAFLYRGDANSVAIAGDANGWNPGAASARATRLTGTDLWVLEQEFPSDARLDYKIVVNGSNWILDPANPLQIWSGFGPNSELRMPDYEFPQETVRRPGVARGALSAKLTLPSSQLGNAVNYRVYTPAGYEAQSLADLPAVYVTDGHEYASDHLGAMTAVMDNLIDAGRMRPALAVFIDPRHAATGVNQRAELYLQNEQFARFVADELVPAVDAAYRTEQSARARTILGTSLGGLNSAYFGAELPDVFGNIAVQSPASFSRFAPGLFQRYRTEPLVERLNVFVSAGTINDGAGGRQFADLLAAEGYHVAFVETNEGHSWGQWRGLLDDVLVKTVGSATPVPEPATPALLGTATAVLACAQRIATGLAERHCGRRARE